MIRLLFRLLATFALAIAVIMAVLDATRSIAASQIVLTPLGTAWASASPGTLHFTQALFQRHLWAPVWDTGATFLLGQPGFAVFAALALIFYVIGHKPRRPAKRLAAV